MADEQPKECVVLYCSLYSPMHHYFHLLSCLEKVKYSVRTIERTDMVPEHCGGKPGAYVDPTLRDKNGHLYEGFAEIFHLIQQRADSLGISLEEKVSKEQVK